jgi:hypothetical protein
MPAEREMRKKDKKIYETVSAERKMRKKTGKFTKQVFAIWDNNYNYFIIQCPYCKHYNDDIGLSATERRLGLIDEKIIFECDYCGRQSKFLGFCDINIFNEIRVRK